MRTIILFSLLITSFGFSSTKNIQINANELNGVWVPVKEEIAGTVLPPAAFEKQKLVINDSTYTFTAESVDKGVLSYNGNKMDIYGREGVNTGKHFTSIYKYENEQLTICYNLAGNGYPEVFETKGKPTLLLCVFKKGQ